MKMKARIRVMLLSAKECPWLPAEHEKLQEEASNRFSLTASEGSNNPANTLIWDFWPPGPSDNEFLLLKRKRLGRKDGDSGERLKWKQ